MSQCLSNPDYLILTNCYYNQFSIDPSCDILGLFHNLTLAQSYAMDAYVITGSEIDRSPGSIDLNDVLPIQYLQ